MKIIVTSKVYLESRWTYLKALKIALHVGCVSEFSKYLITAIVDMISFRCKEISLFISMLVMLGFKENEVTGLNSYAKSMSGSFKEREN